MRLAPKLKPCLDYNRTELTHTEFYDPIQLSAGESIYIDSGMGQTYVCAPGDHQCHGECRSRFVVCYALGTSPSRQKRFFELGRARSPMIARVFPFSEAIEAYRFLESNQQIGKVVIKL